MKKVLLILLIGIFMISFGSALLTDNIEGYYKFDNNNLSNSVSGLAGTNGGTVNGTGKIIDGRDFEQGDPDFINTNTGATIGEDLDFTGDFSICAWVNPESYPTSDTIVVGKRSAAGFQYVFRVDSGKMELLTTGGQLADTSATVSTGSYQFICVSRDDDGNTIFYYNGTAQDSLASNSISHVATDTYIGGQELGGSNWDGLIDEVGLWDRILTPAEITELYNNGNGLTYPFITSGVFVVLSSPSNDSIISQSQTFNATMEPANNFNLTNATLFIWDSDGDIFFSDTNIVTGNTTNTTSFLVTNLTSGNYEWNVLGISENSTGYVSANFSESNYTFTWVPFEVDNESFNLNVYETSRQEFLLNITTLPGVLSVDATLDYNGTQYTADTSCSSGVCQISTAIDIPLVLNGETQNKSFFWRISIFDGTASFSINLTDNEQNVTRLHLEKCDGTYTVQTLNFTAFDEQDQSIINPFNFEGSFDFWIGTGTVRRNNSISENSTASLQLCLSPSEETFYLDSTIEYDEASGANYTMRNYFFQNDTISNSSQDIKLGLLLAEDSTSFILAVQDRDILPVSGALIFTEKFYPGEGIYRVVQVSKTSDDGGTVGFFETETVDYRFVIKQAGTTVLVTNKRKVVGESVPFTLTFTIGDDEGAAWDVFEDIDDLQHGLIFNKSSSVVSFTYLDTSGDFTLAQLIVERVNASGLQNEIVCTKNSSQSSATITCNMTGNSTGQYIARTSITRASSPFLVEQISFAIEDFSTISGRLGLFLGWFVILIAAFAFKFNEVAGIILINLAIIMVNLIGLVSFGYVFISAIVAISIIILVVLER